jgi:hypothetical protein
MNFAFLLSAIKSARGMPFTKGLRSSAIYEKNYSELKEKTWNFWKKCVIGIGSFGFLGFYRSCKPSKMYNLLDTHLFPRGFVFAEKKFVTT